MRAPAKCFILLVVAAISVGCLQPASPGARASCLSAQGSQLVLEGREFGQAWRLFAAPSWKGHTYGLEFQFEDVAVQGCGTVGADDALFAMSGGGGEIDGQQVRYVYGVALPPVSTVRVTFESGPRAELTPVAVAGFEHRFFVRVQKAPAGFSGEALDDQGRVLARL